MNWKEGEGATYRAAPVVPIGSGRTGFTPIAPTTTQITFTNFLPASRHFTNQIYLNGSGVAAGDIDGDGWCDLVFGGLGGRTTIYRNLGNWRFAAKPDWLGSLTASLDASGLALADLDGEGDLDLLLNSVGQGTHVLENQGNGRFVPFRTNGLINPQLGGTSLALADIDGDGHLDVYVTNYRVSTTRDEPHLRLNISQEGGRPKVTGYGGRSIQEPDLLNRFKFSYRPTPSGGATVFHDEQGEPDVLFRNDGSGRLVPVPFTSGTFLNEAGLPLAAPLFDWGLAAQFRDLNRDGAPDLYVCNDFSSPDRVWINDGRGRFRPLTTNAMRQTSLSTMAVDIADIDRDGDDDIFTADMLSPERWRRLVQRNQANPNMHLFVDVASQPQVPRNMLQRNRGDGTYEEVARLLGLEASEWSWGSVFLDVDLDGYEDLLVANGFERDFMNMDANRRVRAAQARLLRDASVATRLAANGIYPRLATPNLAFRNLGGTRFVDVSRAWGFAVPAVSQGMALGDLDNDGDLDVAINNLNGLATILRNDGAAPRVAIQLLGQAPNTRGIGARITVSGQGDQVPVQSQEMIAGGRYLSGDQPVRTFAAGTNQTIMVEVRWRSGRQTVLTNLPVNHLYEIREPSGLVPPNTLRAIDTNGSLAARPLFDDHSARLPQAHAPTAVDDFASQPMLPTRVTAGGPGICVFDLDNDGWDDLLLNGPSERNLVAWRNDRQGGFIPGERIDQGGVGQLSSVLAWSLANTTQVMTSRGVLVSPGADRVGAVEVRSWPSSTGSAALTSSETVLVSSNFLGPMTMADVDADGDLDLFVGGRFVPHRWPEAATSHLLRSEQGRWLPESGPNPFQAAGLVNGALFTDLDSDGDPDLVLATEWGPIRIFVNDGGQFSPRDWELDWGSGRANRPERRLSQLSGWWTGIQSGDLDGDGRLDLVVGNVGRNTDYERFLARPIRVYYGAFAGDDSVGILECAFEPALNRHAPLHDVWTLSKSLPWLLARFDSYEAFARAPIEEILGERFASARFVEGSWPETTAFLNRGNHFEVRPLPAAAQVAPGWSVVIQDFDGDAREDVFLAQNFYGVRSDASRLDSGRGLILLGDGRGAVRALSSGESGLRLEGEQRGAGVGDFDRDGRADLVVAQHGGPVGWFRNTSAPAGVRVRLKGSAGNRSAIGAVIRIGTPQRWGPVREIQAGSGYWSQNSSVQIMARPAGANRVQVRWPGGRMSETTLGPEQLEMELTAPD